MRKILPLLLVVFIFKQAAYSQGGTWVWVNGPAGANGHAVYGTQGVPSVNNVPPPVYEAANWVDRQGNFWIYGGVVANANSVTEVSDLWKYNPTANTWTWVSGPGQPGSYGAVYGTRGVPAPGNNPGSRGWGTITWTDENNNLWLYGGSPTGAQFGDVWVYNISLGQWTWMNGQRGSATAAVYGPRGVLSPISDPGGRSECTTAWNDNTGNLWFFGGEIPGDADFDNSIWKYNIAANQWAYMNGAPYAGAQGNYGVKGVAAAGNQPSARFSYTNWKDIAGNFYIFGGNDYRGAVSDVWKFDPVNNIWTWVAGDSSAGAVGQYIQYCVEEGSTGPRARFENRSSQMLGCGANACLTFGGNILNGGLNDLWLFNTETYTWKWLSGPDSVNSPGNYGIKGVAAPGNLPPARCGHCQWLDNNGVLWVFGGNNSNSVTGEGYYNDMWKFIPDSACMQLLRTGGLNTRTPLTAVCQGDSAPLVITGGSNIHIAPAASVNIVSSDQIWLTPDTTTTYLITGKSICGSNDSTRVTIQVVKPGMISYTLPDTQLCAGSSVLLSMQGQSTTTITPLTGVTMADSAHYILQPDTTTTYHLYGTSALCGGPDTAVFTIHVSTHTPASITINDTVLCSNENAVVTTTGLSHVQLTDNVYTTYSQNGNVITIKGLNSGQQTFTVTGNTTCGSVYARTFTLNWMLPGNLFYSVNAPDICRGDTALLTVSNASGLVIQPAGQVHWLDNAHALLFPDTTTTYRVSGTGVCTAHDTAAFTVHVVSGNVPDYTLSTPTVCDYASNVRINVYGLKNATLNPPLPTFIYTDSDDAYALFFVGDSTLYTLTGTGICGLADTATFIIKMSAPPVITTATTTICPHDSTVLCASPGFISYLWNTGQTSTCIAALATGNYYVTVTDAGHCTATSAPIAITDVQGSVINITQQADTLSIPPATDIQWYLNGHAIPGATQHILVATLPGTYTVSELNNQCGTVTSNGIAILPLGITNITGNDVTLYPNPSTGSWFLSANQNFTGSPFEVFDAGGRIVYHALIESPITEISTLAAGVYLLRIQATTGVIVKKMIKL